MLRFRRIYFDSNVAIKEGWPRFSAAFKQVLQFAQMFKVPVVMLDVVERELEAHWVRDYVETCKAIGGVKAIHDRVGVKTDLQLPVLSEIRAAYRGVVDKTVQEHGIERVAAALRPTSEFFELAIQETKPFQRKGKNFQDAVIVLAAIDDLASKPGEVRNPLGINRVGAGAFLSRDGVFDQQTLDALSRSAKVQLTLFPDLDQMLDVFGDELSQALKATWDNDQRQAADALNENADLLKKYIAEHVEIPTDQAFFGDEILSVESIENIKVLHARTSAPWEREEGQPAIFTAEVDVDFRAVVRPRLYLSLFQPVAKVVKVGGETQITSNALVSGSQSNEPREQLISRTVELEIKGTLADKRYTNL